MRKIARDNRNLDVTLIYTTAWCIEALAPPRSCTWNVVTRTNWRRSTASATSAATKLRRCLADYCRRNLGWLSDGTSTTDQLNKVDSQPGAKG